MKTIGEYQAIIRGAGRTVIGLGWTQGEARRNALSMWSEATGYPAVALDPQRIAVEHTSRGEHVQ
jgi:hypothetical protein